MLRLIKYNLIQRIRRRDTMFWSLLFPLVLGTLYYVSFGNGNSKIEVTEEIRAAVVESQDNMLFDEYMNAAEERMEILQVRGMTKEEAGRKLSEGKIDGIFYVDEEIRLEVAESGISSNILKSLLDDYNQSSMILADIGATNPERIPYVIENMSHENMIETVSLGGRITDIRLQYFFALIAMTCLFGCNMGFDSGMSLKANQTFVGARISVVPVRRGKMVIAAFLSAFLVQLFNIMLTLVFLKYGLRIYLFDDLGRVILISVVGSMLGVSLGVFVASVGKAREIVKSMTLLFLSLASSSLAGLMNENVKIVAEQKIPLLKDINPATLISDAFYCMAVYDNPERFWKNVIILGFMTAVLLAGSFLALRRMRYESL